MVKTTSCGGQKLENFVLNENVLSALIVEFIDKECVDFQVLFERHFLDEATLPDIVEEDEGVLFGELVCRQVNLAQVVASQSEHAIYFFAANFILSTLKRAKI